jgi:HlyD family secretion protein
VRRIAPYALDVEKQARTVDVEVEFNSPKETDALLVGYSADVEVVLDAREDVLRVPTTAIQEGPRVLVFDPQRGRLEQRRIETGLSNWEFSEVRSGLKQGEQVVISLERRGVAPGVKATPEAAQGKPPAP